MAVSVSNGSQRPPQPAWWHPCPGASPVSSTLEDLTAAGRGGAAGRRQGVSAAAGAVRSKQQQHVAVSERYSHRLLHLPSMCTTPFECR